MIYLFDVDGTLTEPRKKIDKDFEKFFLNFIKEHEVYLISGSDYIKTLDQLGDNICNNVSGVYSCSGNEFRIANNLIYKNDWFVPDELISELEKILFNSKYFKKLGNHIEIRTGSINFSIVGRNASEVEREEYLNWDNVNKERKEIVSYLNTKFKDLDFDIGGSISIDIYPKGKDKSQIIKNFNKPIYFFGDRTEIGGNDYKIASNLNKNIDKVFKVKNYKDTFNILYNII